MSLKYVSKQETDVNNFGKNEKTNVNYTTSITSETYWCTFHLDTTYTNYDLKGTLMQIWKSPCMILLI